ncbi:MAG: penicillin-binding protein [Lachnospiraceae bacterium]|nr:penicillin-binding protein [Lachnospiraceae bacterium]
MGNNVRDRAKSVGKIILGTIGSYLGIISNIIGTILGILASILVICLIAGICVYVKVIPMFTEAREVVFDNLVNMSEEDFIMNEDTIVYDDNGKKVGSVNAGRYKYVKISNISPYIYNGYISVEDKRFKTHGGVDFLATMRAGVALLKNNGEITQGGSTITQQVIKNNLLTQEKSFTRKMAEILLAPTVEAKFGKDKIMEFYCNSNYYGNRCYGVGAASKFYFGKKASELEPEEAALLIGLSNSPSAYNPVANPEAALKKRNEVLKKMYQGGAITKKEYNRGIKAEIKVLQMTEKSASESYVVSYAVHCAALALMEQENFEFQYTFKDKKEYQEYREKYSSVYGQKCDDIRSGGYKIYTSINQKLQKKLQKAVDAGLAYSTEKASDGRFALQGAAVSVDNTSRYVVAIVGGRGTKDAYNRAYLSARQSGSAIKPLIDYAPGFESGAFSPSTVVNDHAIENGPKNAGGSYRGRVPVREAVARSLNTVAWQVLETITPEYGMSFLEKMHFHNLSYVDNGNMALSLGGFTEGVRVVDMAKGYSALANNGVYSDRTCVRKIEHVSDGTIYKDAEETNQVYSQDSAWLMTDVLKGVFEESYGTGRSLKLSGGQIAAGKTGTTNSSKDVWFCGYTAYYSTVVWAGYDTPRAMPGASGASIPGVIWKNYMNEIHKNLEPKDFEVPETIRLAKYDSAGNIIEGTEESGRNVRSYGKDYFATQILEKTSEYVDNAKDEVYQKKVLKKLLKFEKMSITSIADYYTLEQTYTTLKTMIASIADDKVRKTYSTRCTDKYNSMKDETVAWKDVVAAYEAQQAEENERIVQENAKKSQEARDAQTKKTRIALAKTRLKKLTGHKYKPENLSSLLSSALSAIEKCKSYPEYSDLYSAYRNYKAQLQALPTKEEYEAGQNPAAATDSPSGEEQDEMDQD